MQYAVAALERFERLPAVETAREVLREAFGLELSWVDAAGPLAHRRGAVMTGSNELCRTALFSREGFARCHAFYCRVGERSHESPLECHLGLGAQHAPVIVGGAVLGHLVASGFLVGGTGATTAVTRSDLAAGLLELDPDHPEPQTAASAVRLVDATAEEFITAVLRVAARAIERYEEASCRTVGDGTVAPGCWGIVGESPPMRELFEVMRRVVQSEATVLITGESGTGKELVARALHERGARSGGPFVVANCGAVAEGTLESTLFGHVHGAFSGASESRRGLLGAASGGTLFLDEVGEMPPAMQVKLLRVLQDGTYLPVGATQVRKAEIRVVAASHRDLGAMVSAGTFREDLFYRLHVLTLRLPPLRERLGDIRHLVEHFAGAQSPTPPELGPEAWRCFERYHWPGNVRELRAEMARLSVAAVGARSVGPEHLSAAVRDAGGYGESAVDSHESLGSGQPTTLAAAVESLERRLIARGLERTGGNRTQLARELGVSRTTLNERLKRYGLA